MTKYTQAQAKAIRQYMQEKVENIQLRVPKGKKEVIKAASIRAGLSMNQFIVQAIDHEIEAAAADEANTAAAVPDPSRINCEYASVCPHLKR